MEVYYCATAAGNSRFTSNNSHQKGKAKIGSIEQHQHFVRKSSRTAKRTDQLIASKTGNNPGSTANKEIVKDIAELTRIFPRTTTKKFAKSFAPKTCSNQRSTVNTHLQTDQTRSDNIAQSIDISHHQNMPGKTMTTEGKYAKIPYEEVQLIFHSILHNERPRSTIDFKVVTVPFQHLAKSPPPYDFEGMNCKHCWCMISFSLFSQFIHLAIISLLNTAHKLEFISC